MPLKKAHSRISGYFLRYRKKVFNNSWNCFNVHSTGSVTEDGTKLVKAFKDLPRSQKQSSVVNYKDVGTTRSPQQASPHAVTP